jgi:hypothetical protein
VIAVNEPSDIAAANVRAFSAAALDHSDRFSNKAFTLSLTLTDGESKQAQTLTFHGLVSGTMTPLNPNLQITLPDAHQSAHLGHHIYDVTLRSFRTYGTSWGAIYAHVDVHHNPEPGSLVLAGLGGSFAWLAYRRKGARRP